jgi:cytochrome P450
VPVPIPELDILRDLRARSQAEGGVFWVGDDELAVFDPELAQKVDAANFSDLTLSDGLADVLRGRKSEKVSWKQVRGAWAVQLHRLSGPEGMGALAARLDELLDQRLGRSLDLVCLAQETSTRAFLPIVLVDLPAGAMARLLRAHGYRIEGLLTSRGKQPFWERSRTVWIVAAAGLAVRRELRSRAAGRRPRRLDLADPIVDLLPALGIDRAAGAVSALLAAIAGPPGAAVACLMYELARRHDWEERLAAELTSVSPAELYANAYEAPGRVAPVAHRFIKETLRLWGPPLLMTRQVRTEIHLDNVYLKVGQRYLLSPHLMQHDPRHWKDPETFDPDRWLPGADRGPRSAGAYVPFGFSPMSCIGAGLGTALLLLMCHLLCTRYRLQVPDPETVRMSLGAAALPVNFHGVLTQR